MTGGRPKRIREPGGLCLVVGTADRELPFLAWSGHRLRDQDPAAGAV
jgi:hypothetical protein